jgi:UDP-glucose 4-epimerase
MTRFLLSLDQAVDCILAALSGALAGEIFIPRIRSARVVDIAKALIGDRRIDIRNIGIRPGEKLHEVLVTEEEATRTRALSGYYVIAPLLPELRSTSDGQGALDSAYSSSMDLMSAEEVIGLLSKHGLLDENTQHDRQSELLR